MTWSEEDRRVRALRALVYLALAAGTVLLVYRLRGALTPIFLAFLIAYAADPAVDVLERRRVPRWLGSVIVLFGLIGAGVLVLFLLVPALLAEVTAFVATLPAQIDSALARLEPWVQRNFQIALPHTFREAVDRWGTEVQTFAPRVAAPLGVLLGGAASGVISIIGFVVQAIIVPVFAYYLLVDFDRIVARVRVLVPPRHRPGVGHIFREVDETMAGFLRGQFTLMLIQAVLYAVALGLLGVPLGVGIGLLTGLLAFVPYVGIGLGLVLALLMAFIDFQGWGVIAGIVAVYGGMNLFDGFVLTPRIVGGKVGLGPVAVLVALMVCGELFGFLGVLLAVPLAAVVKILVKHGLLAYMASSLFGTEEERARALEELEAAGPTPPTPPGEPVAERVLPTAESLREETDPDLKLGDDR